MKFKLQQILIPILLIFTCLLSSCTNITEPNAIQATPEISQETATPTETPHTEIYIGNKRSKIFHRYNCRMLPEYRNQVKFSSREEAIRENYTPCGNCQP